MTKFWPAVVALALSCFVAGGATAAPSDAWASYLDYAFVYSSAEPKALQARLERYAKESGATLRDDLEERVRARGPNAVRDEADQRRTAIAHLLDYLATGRGESLASAVRAIDELKDRLQSHENRYWYHTIHAHEALKYADPEAFVSEILSLWFRVVVELETSYDTYQILSLDRSTRVGFAAALPYLYENIARLILIRSQQMGLDHGLDALAAVVRFLADGRVGSDPEVIPSEASSRDYLDRIVARLNGPESDGGSLTFTLALFEAAKHHDRARTLLASEGFSKPALQAIRVSIGAYQRALQQARTLQGQAAVYTRVLRQMGELYAAKQRLGVDPDIDIPFRIERAVQVYAALRQDPDNGWRKHGYRDQGRAAYVAAMRSLWEEIQEASFNTSEYYLARGVREGDLGNESLAAAARFYSRYLSLFRQYAESAASEFVPDSAYFAAYWAAKGIGDSLLNATSGNPSSAQIDQAIERYQQALTLFPFDRQLWSAIALSLQRQGRDEQYLPLTKPTAEAVARSRSLHAWIHQGRQQATALDTLRRALSDDLVIMYLGFADVSALPELEEGLATLRSRRSELGESLAELRQQLEALRAKRAATLSPQPAPPAALPPVSAAPTTFRDEITRVTKRMEELNAAQERLDAQIEARSRALPLFRQSLETDGLVTAMVAQRDHPLHTLVRRMYFERQEF